MSTRENRVCQRCRGCGRIANSDDGEPWSVWEGLPAASQAAVRLGLVRPVPCPDCQGTSRRAEPEPQAVTPLLIRDLEERSAVGTRKYGRTLSTFNGRAARVPAKRVMDADEEALDLAQYLKQALMEQEAARGS